MSCHRLPLQLDGQKVSGAEDEDELYQYPKTGTGPIFASIENILRCAICREVSEPPLSLPCCRGVFCSLCIRQYMDIAIPRCPICRRNATPHDLILSKELRSVCSIWKKHRLTILAAARVTTSGAGEECANASAVKEGGGGGPGRRRGVGPGQGRKGGRLNAIHYHSTKDAQLRKLLAELGLPTAGSKAAMSARHRRLVLLDASSSDREVPLPRSELIRQVAVWEREKAREKAAAARTAQSNARSTALLSASASQSPAGTGEGVDGAPAEAPAAVVVSPKMNEGFAALIAQAKANAAKKRAKPSSAGTDGANSKRPRGVDSVQEDSINGASVGTGHAGGGSVSTDPAGCSGSVGSSGSIDSGAVRSGVLSVGGPSASSTASPNTMGDKKKALMATAARTGGRSFMQGLVGDEAEMRILGVAGRMVRTRGPWRCVFSKRGTAPPLECLKPRCVTSARPPEHEEEPASLTKGPDLSSLCGGNDGASCDGGEGRDAALQPVEAAGKRGVTRNSGCGEDAAAAGIVRGGEERRRVVASNGNGRVGGDAAMSEAVSGENNDADIATKGEGDVDHNHGVSGVLGNDVDAIAEQGEEAEGHFVYLNMVTGELTREPPPELVAQSEEAEQAGGFLIFIPSHCFVGAAPASGAAAAAIASSALQTWKPAAALASAAEALPEAACGGLSGGKLGEECRASTSGEEDGLVGDNGDGRIPSSLASPEATHARQHSSSGDEAWHRLGGMSEPGMTLAASRQSSGTATPGGGASLATSVGSPVDARPTFSASMAPAAYGGDSLSLTIDLSQESAVVPSGAGEQSRVGDGCTGDGSSVATGVAGAVEAKVWACLVCTLENAMKVRRCQACCTARPESSGSQGNRTDSGSAKRHRGDSRLRLPVRRTNPPRSTITAFASRPPGASSSTSVGGGGGALSRPLEASSSTPALPTAAPTEFATVRSSKRSAAVSAEGPSATEEE